MKLGASSYFRRSVMLAAACILAVVLTACTGRGGGYLPPQTPVFTGQAAFGFTFSCQNGESSKIELAYNDKGSNPIGSSFGIHGIVDTIDPVLESADLHRPRARLPRLRTSSFSWAVTALRRGRRRRSRARARHGRRRPRRCAASR